jgi:sugar phosphate isomerase/epimerase
MVSYTRRKFVQVSAAVVAYSPSNRVPPAAVDKGIRLGLMIHTGRDPQAALKRVGDLGFPTCQVGIEDYDAEMERRFRDAVEETGLEVTTLVTLGKGPMVWDFYQGPQTIGLVPAKFRQARVEHMKRASDFAKSVGIPAIHTHCGFIPEDPNDPVFADTVRAIRDVASHCRANGQTFLYETGQETPVTLLRTIREVALDNQGINLDTANLILYGKGNPVDALDVIGPLVRGVHAKDGLYPTDPRKLGEEVPIGQGKVDFPRLITRLRELNYRGAITIEREIGGARQIEDVRRAKAFLEGLIA